MVGNSGSVIDSLRKYLHNTYGDDNLCLMDSVLVPRIARYFLARIASLKQENASYAILLEKKNGSNIVRNNLLQQIQFAVSRPLAFEEYDKRFFVILLEKKYPNDYKEDYEIIPYAKEYFRKLQLKQSIRSKSYAQKMEKKRKEAFRNQTFVGEVSRRGKKEATKPAVEEESTDEDQTLSSLASYNKPNKSAYGNLKKKKPKYGNTRYGNTRYGKPKDGKTNRGNPNMSGYGNPYRSGASSDAEEPFSKKARTQPRKETISTKNTSASKMTQEEAELLAGIGDFGFSDRDFLGHKLDDNQQRMDSFMRKDPSKKTRKKSKNASERKSTKEMHPKSTQKRSLMLGGEYVLNDTYVVEELQLKKVRYKGGDNFIVKEGEYTGQIIQANINELK